MLLLVPVTIAILISLWRGGSLRHLATLRVRGWNFFVASFALQFLFYVTPLRHSSLATHWGSEIYLGAMSLAALGAIRNWQMGAAARLATVGIVLNITVIALNGGHMPVNAAALAAVQGTARLHQVADKHLYGNTRPADRSARLLMLSDIIPVRLPTGYGNVYSIGDMLLSAGVSLLAYRTVRSQVLSP